MGDRRETDGFFKVENRPPHRHDRNRQKPIQPPGVSDVLLARGDAGVPFDTHAVQFGRPSRLEIRLLPTVRNAGKQRRAPEMSGCIPRNAYGNSLMSDSVGLVHESLSAARSRNRRDVDPTDSWPTDDRDSIHGIRVDSRDSRAVLFLPTNHTNERESKSAPRCAAVRSGRSFPIPIPNCTAFRPRHLGTDYKVGKAPLR